MELLSKIQCGCFFRPVYRLAVGLPAQKSVHARYTAKCHKVYKRQKHTAIMLEIVHCLAFLHDVSGDVSAPDRFLLTKWY